MKLLIEMLQWKRPGSSDFATKMFADKYLRPVFGAPDDFGNFVHIIKDGDVEPDLCFTAHYDTVHSNGGFQDVEIIKDVVSVPDSDCLGADCTTGIYLILEMIDAGIPGVYVIHADEESGCKGSRALVASEPDWLFNLNAVISFDRYGDTSVVTHQMGARTASDNFARSFASALDLPTLTPDSSGVYTDSNEYADVVPECTNISVGYYNQHTSRETQDLVFLEQLRLSLLNADWSKIVIERDPSITEFKDRSPYESGWYFSDEDRDYYSKIWEKDDLLELILAAPEALAEFFYARNITAAELAEEAGIDSSLYLSKYLERG